MIIAHLPAGYLLTRFCGRRFGERINDYRRFMFWGLFGSVAPDLDLFYDYFFDHGRMHHHKYFTHFPIVWLGLLALAWIVARRRPAGVYALMFAAGGSLHLILDSVVGDIWWLAPFVDRPFSLAKVPALYQPWWFNFLLHWSFLLELAITAWAVRVWRRARGSHANRIGSPAGQRGEAQWERI